MAAEPGSFARVGLPSQEQKMILTVKLFATFQEGRFAKEDREYPDGTRIQDIVDDLKLPRDEVGILLVNGRHAEFEFQPAAGMTVAIFPTIGGG
jgi:molybdopterin converting factor small subunit